MSRSRVFCLFLLLVPFAFWIGGRAPDRAVTAEEPVAEEKKPVFDDAYWYQVKVICDWPELPAFQAGEVRVPAGQQRTVVVFLAAGADPAGPLKDAVAGAAGGKEFAVRWVAPDEATAKRAREAGVEGTSGGVADNTDDIVPIPIRPALLMVNAEGRIEFAHFPGSHWDAELFAIEARRMSGARMTHAEAKVTKTIQGSLSCAPCHRGVFKDWLMTPHSDAFRSLESIHREEDPDCVGCHVVAMNEGGYANRKTDRRLADVGCESCHMPDRTHNLDKPMVKDDYIARCNTCHTPSFSLFSSMEDALKYIRHPQALAAERLFFRNREGYITEMKKKTYLEFCSKTDYVGTAKCKECHEKAHGQWSGTAHATAFARLKDGKENDPTCTKCHVTGQGLPGGFKDLATTPHQTNVGCESCHGPGKRHIEAKTPEERKASIFKFDEKCPICVVDRICRACHDSANDPEFDLIPALQKVRHREK